MMIFAVLIRENGCTITELSKRPYGYRKWFEGANCEFWVRNDAYAFSTKYGKSVKVGVNARMRDMVNICVLSKCYELHIPLAEIRSVHRKRLKKPLGAIKSIDVELDDGTIETVEICQQDIWSDSDAL